MITTRHFPSRLAASMIGGSTRRALPRANGKEDETMTNATREQPSRRTVALGAALGAFAITTEAMAALCPPGKEGVDVMGPGATMPKGVSDTVMGSIDLINEKVKLAGYQLRTRRLVIEPGGEVPWHSHAERPAMIYILQGTITEYKSTCSVPLVHSAGDLAVETREVSHWWKNTGDQPVIILSFDLFHKSQDPRMM
jgi:quercetin dioxygenase-like cupin family protein